MRKDDQHLEIDAVQIDEVDISRFTQLKLEELRTAFKSRVIELGGDTRTPPTYIYKQLAKETGVNFRTLRNYYEGEKEVKSYVLKKLMESFRFVRLSRLEDPIKLCELILNEHFKGLVMTYGRPQGESLADHQEKLQKGMDGIKRLWRNFHKDMPLDPSKILKYKVDKGKEITECFSKWEKEGIYIYANQVVSFNTIPFDTAIVKGVVDDDGAPLNFRTTMYAITTIAPFPAVVVEVDWSKLFYFNTLRKK